jgi:hypothetical protein
MVRVMGSFTLLEGSRLFSCIGLGDVGHEGTMVSFRGDGACGVDEACSVMMVM